MTLIRTGYPMYCAHFPGGDPRRFEPDPDGVTPAELAAWEAACRAADEQAGEAASLDSSAFYERHGDVSVMGHVTMFGPGTYYFEEDFMDEEEEICGETMEHDIDHQEYCEEDGRTYWHCRRCDAEGFDSPEPPAEPAGPAARAEARADRHERLGGGRGGRVGGWRGWTGER